MLNRHSISGTDNTINTTYMLNNYFKIIFRNLRRYKSYTFINILGMAIGIAAMVWGYQDYKFSFSFDDFHTFHACRVIWRESKRAGIEFDSPAESQQLFDEGRGAKIKLTKPAPA